MTALEAYKKYGSVSKAAKEIGMSTGGFHYRLKKDQARTGKLLKQPVIPKGGLDELRTKFGKVEIETRRISKNHQKLEHFIEGTLKKAKWMSDGDVRTALGLSSVDFSLLRQDFLHLTLEATDENRKKMLLWIHPTHMDEAREIITGTES